MSIPNLPVNFKDDILNTGVNQKRKYQQTYNADGSVSFEDVTAYQQKGSNFGAQEVNETNGAVNNIYSERILDLNELELVTEPGFFVDAQAVKEAYDALNSKTLNGTKVTLVEYDATTSIVSKTLPKPISSFKALLIRAKCTRTDGSAENLYNYLPVATLDNWWFQSNNTNRLYYNFERQGETESARGWVTPQGDSQMAFHRTGRGIVFYVYGLE